MPTPRTRAPRANAAAHGVFEKEMMAGWSRETLRAGLQVGVHAVCVRVARKFCFDIVLCSQDIHMSF